MAWAGAAIVPYSARARGGADCELMRLMATAVVTIAIIRTIQGRRLAYLIFSLVALTGDPIY